MTGMDQLPGDIAAFVSAVDSPQKQLDALVLIEIMARVTGHPPRMWGTTMIGFDSYHYKYASGREGDSFLTGFSPRKQKLVVYITPGFDAYNDLIARLGKHKSSVSCLYINKLSDVDMAVLEELIAKAYTDMKARNHIAGS